VVWEVDALKCPAIMFIKIRVVESESESRSRGVGRIFNLRSRSRRKF